MAMVMGFVKAVSDVDGNVQIEIETGSGPEVTGILMGPAGIMAVPLPGDMIIFERTGRSIAVIATVTEALLESGEIQIYSRKADGTAAASISLMKDGGFEIQNENGSFIMDSTGKIDMNNGALTVEP